MRPSCRLNIEHWLLPGSRLPADLVDIGFHGAVVALCDVEHLGLEALDFLVEADAVRVMIIGNGQRTIAVAGFPHGIVAFKRRLDRERPVSRFCLGAELAQVTTQMIHL